MSAEIGTLRVTSAILASNGSPMVCMKEGDGDELLLTPDQAEQIAQMLQKSAVSARALSAQLASRPGALACFISNPAGRA